MCFAIENIVNNNNNNNNNYILMCLQNAFVICTLLVHKGFIYDIQYSCDLKALTLRLFNSSHRANAFQQGIQ